MEQHSRLEAYLLHAWIRDIHPMLWRRFLVRSDCTLAGLHFVLQIGFAWTDFHLHRFRIRKKDYGTSISGEHCKPGRPHNLYKNFGDPTWARRMYIGDLLG
jgi:hypothetical protein